MRRNNELDRMEHEAQITIKNARIDLDLFLSYSVEQRAAMWRQWDASAKHQAVVQMLVRKYGDWTDAEVADWIAKYDAKWAAQPSTLEAAAAGAFEQAAEEIERAARYAAGELAAIEADREILERARRMFDAGVRPEQLEGGMWRVRSERGSGYYQITRNGACTCPDAVNRNRTCKHAKLVAMIEQANEYRDTHDAYDAESDYARAARKALGVRLTAARRVYVEAI